MWGSPGSRGGLSRVPHRGSGAPKVDRCSPEGKPLSHRRHLRCVPFAFGAVGGKWCGAPGRQGTCCPERARNEPCRTCTAHAVQVRSTPAIAAGLASVLLLALHAVCPERSRPEIRSRSARHACVGAVGSCTARWGLRCWAPSRAGADVRAVSKPVPVWDSSGAV